MGTQPPWAGSGTTNPSNPAAGTEVDVRSPSTLEVANGLLIRNTGGTHALLISWDEGETFATTIPANSFIQISDVSVSDIHVKADSGSTTYEWLANSAH